MKKDQKDRSSWEKLVTESVHPGSLELDTMSSLEIVDFMNREDREVLRAVRRERKNIARAVDMIHSSLRDGGKLTYVGAGTSGRLGVLDASECPPTFGTDPGMVRGVIAGGPGAVWRSVEGAEDDPSSGAATIRRKVRRGDTVVGISASSVTPFVRGGLAEAGRKGAGTVLVTCVPSRSFSLEGLKVDVLIAPVVGPEILTGSTRLKAGTATKMILNMLSTGTMILLGKTYGNLMVDLKPWSRKLKDRAVRIVEMASGRDRKTAADCLARAGWDTKLAILMAMEDISKREARRRLKLSDGDLRRAARRAPHYVRKLRRGRKKQ